MPSPATGSSIRCCSIRACATSAWRQLAIGAVLEASLRRVLGGATFEAVVRDKREELMRTILRR